ncbi:MAG: hypothetical protein V4474_00695 [Patescibacteria group bacterium]
MQANKAYLKQPKSFWAQVKLVSMTLGYSRTDEINIYSIEKIVDCLKGHKLSTDHLVNKRGIPTKEGALLVSYFKYRSQALKQFAQPNLMDRDKAKATFEKLYRSFKSTVSIPYNKQKGEKKHYAYLTGIVNLLTERTLGNTGFDSDPRKVVVVTKNGKPLQTLTRRVDGVYPSTTNPIALWEIKEYYGTTTFGSRVADGVYETMLDGYEIEELRSRDGIDTKHYLIVDDYFTWWKCGKSYLCRMVDMLHEGFVDEVIFGKEVLKRWPEIVKSWPKATKSTVIGREHLLRS